MEIGPILSALRRNKTGAMLIAMQIALTLAIVCNSLFLVREYTQNMQRPSGVDEANIFTMANQWVGTPDLKARILEDLAVLRATPGVVDATVANSFPLRGGGWSTSIDVKPIVEGRPNLLSTAQYFVDDHVAAAWGAQLIAGRWFTAADVVDFEPRATTPAAPVVIVSKGLADKLFPAGDALGKTVYYPEKPSVIVGIVARLQTPWPDVGSFGVGFVESSMLMPVLFVNNGVNYTVRTRP
ncbi:MAG TPA: ABC transporter permease, partial [Steroidobacteraceae bacterium]|nr:ABC transporter permease [Steroidobacteraceae bacterium]